MHARASQPTKRILKRSSFIHQSRILEKKDPVVLDQEPQAIPPVSPFPPGKRRSSPSSRTTSQELKTRNPDRPGAEITDPRVYPVQLPSEQGDPCLDRWACHCSSQRRRWSVHQVQRRGIKPLVSNWKVLNKLQSGGRGLESSSNRN